MARNYGSVERTERLAPNLVRVVMGGDGLERFTSTEFTDQYVNALFIPDGAPYSVPFDVEAARALGFAQSPKGRRLTVRSWDAAARRLTLDVVTHGEAGYAGAWAGRARPGDLLQMLGPSGDYRPDPDADWHLWAGDESALAAIAASLEVVPAGKPGVVLIVVDGPDHEIPLASPGDVEVRWLHRASADTPASLLPDAIAGLDWPAGRADVFVHGEAGEVRSVRRHLLAERGVDPSRASISPYWRRHHTDEKWREIKKEWLAEQTQDVAPDRPTRTP